MIIMICLLGFPEGFDGLLDSSGIWLFPLEFAAELRALARPEGLIFQRDLQVWLFPLEFAEELWALARPEG